MLHTLKDKDIFDTIQQRNKWRILLPSIVLIIFFLTEFISKILKFVYFDFIRVSGVVKLVFEIFVLFYLFKHKKYNWKELFKIIILFSALYILGQLFLNNGTFWERFLLNIYSLNGYLFLFIIFFALKTGSNLDKLILKKQLIWLDRTLLAIFILNTSTIFIGLLFDLNIFKTYLGVSDRFGFNGMFLLTSHSSYIYIIFMLYFYSKYLTIKNTANLVLFIAAILTSILLGTKTVYFFNLLFFIYLLIKFSKPLISILVVFSIFSIFILNYSNFVLIFHKNFKDLSDLYESSGLLTMLFSTRNLAITNDFVPYISNNWSFLNYLFGGAEFNIGRTEIELIDLFWFFGFLGGILYLRYFYITFLVILFKNEYLRVPLGIFLICIVLSGSFFTNAPVMPYFVIFFYALANKFKFV